MKKKNKMENEINEEKQIHHFRWCLHHFIGRIICRFLLLFRCMRVFSPELSCSFLSLDFIVRFSLAAFVLCSFFDDDRLRHTMTDFLFLSVSTSQQLKLSSVLISFVSAFFFFICLR